jgi:signal peptidase II
MNSPDATVAADSVDGAGKYLLVIGLGLAIVALDQWSKLWVDATMRLYESIPIVDGFFNLTYVRNKGAAFSLFADMPAEFRLPFLVGAAVLGVIAIFYFVYQTPRSDKVVLFACGFILGGAVGNLVDRVAYGSVIDFLDVYRGDWHWPAFNVADSFITTGVVLLLLQSFFARD